MNSINEFKLVHQHFKPLCKHFHLERSISGGLSPSEGEESAHLWRTTGLACGLDGRSLCTGLMEALHGPYLAPDVLEC